MGGKRAAGERVYNSTPTGERKGVRGCSGGVGLEAAVRKYDGANTRALVEVKQGLIEKGHPRLLAITEKDWLMTSHFDSGVCSATDRVCGLGSWRGEAIWADGKKGFVRT